MKKQLLLILLVVLAGVFNPTVAMAKHHRHTAQKPRHHGALVDSSAGYADIVIDAETGRVIHETNADDLRHPASLTKMMTLYLTFQALEAGRLNLGQSLPVSENASYQSPSKLGLHAGQHIRVQDAILGLVTESANDAAVVLGEAMGGSEEGFAQLMTRQAHALGMNQTVFHNPSGLPDPDQVTTAHDMAVLGDALVNHFPQFYPYFSHESFTYAGIYHHNHNHLMDRYDGMDGIKTGYIRASGFNLVASAKRNGVRLIGVVFGGHSAVARDNHMAQLLDACFPIAIAERSSGQVKQAEAQGDSGDGEKDDTIALPAKVAAIFPGRGLTDTVAPTRAVTAAPAQTSTSVETVVAVSQPQANTTPAVNSDAVQTARDATFPATISRATIPRATVRVEQPTAVRAAVPTGSWGIQIGAYSDAAIGRQALANLMTSMPDQLGKADAQVQPVSSGGIAMYRARLMALDKKTAQSVCSYLIQRGKSCLTVEP